MYLALSVLARTRDQPYALVQREDRKNRHRRSRRRQSRQYQAVDLPSLLGRDQFLEAGGL